MRLKPVIYRGILQFKTCSIYYFVPNLIKKKDCLHMQNYMYHSKMKNKVQKFMVKKKNELN